MSESSSDLIFISYATPDRERVILYHDALKARGYDVWMDVRNLKAGQKWDFEIRRALDKAALVIVAISKNSVTRRGYVQREIQIALDKAMEKLSSDTYLIPILLDDDATLPEQLRDRHMVRAGESDCIEKIEESIKDQLERLGSSVAEAQGQSNVRWSRSNYKDSWDGLPGYEAEFGLLHFSSEQYPKVGEVTEVIRGQLLSSVSAMRYIKFDQHPEHHDFGQQRHFRSHTWEAFPGEPKIVGKILSLQYSVHAYTGGAHGNMHFLPFCFLLDPLVPIERLEHLFADEEKALVAIRDFVRKQLLGRTDEENSLDGQEETVLKGTENWDAFQCFGFDKDGLELSFPPYQVAAYMSGPQFVQMPFAEFNELLKPWAKHALDHW